MFPGFETAFVDTGETTIFIRRKGGGKPLLLLHGFPETHLMWHQIAPALADEFTIVCADLRGYGASGKPPSTPDHVPYSKSVMALDMIRVMGALGYPRFAVAGHDRGARVAYRMALEHTDHVERLAVLDVIPGSATRVPVTMI
jgi:haloacetate dehalogenase